MSDQIRPPNGSRQPTSLATVAHQPSSAMHEANNLLQVTAGSAEMIQSSVGLPDDAETGRIIAEHAHRVSSLLGKRHAS